MTFFYLQIKQNGNKNKSKINENLFLMKKVLNYSYISSKTRRI